MNADAASSNRDERLPPPSRGGLGRALFWLLLIASLGLNVAICSGVAMFGGAADADSSTIERFVGGKAGAHDKVAIIRVEGVIMEGALGHVHQQIDEACRDDAVKAVVLRIVSPGGSITASDDLLMRLEQLRAGSNPKFIGKQSTKPLVVSMGALAASGGYYIAMAAAKPANDATAKMIFAERTTITGSIGVYASLPNAKELCDKIGVKMELIKAGDIKGSGSPFHEMSPNERQPWQDMVEFAYRQFISVVEKGRPELKGKLTSPLFPPHAIAKYDDKGNRIEGEIAGYTRRLADGGIFTSAEALEYRLVDVIGTQEEAAATAAAMAGLKDYKVVKYDKPITLLTALTGIHAPNERVGVRNALGMIDTSPRLWYVLPHAEIAARASD